MPNLNKPVPIRDLPSSDTTVTVNVTPATTTEEVIEVRASRQGDDNV